MTAGDRYKIALNIVAKIGLDNPQFINEYSRAVSFTQGMDSFNAMQAQQMVTPPSVMQPPMGNNMPTEPLGGGGLPMEGQQPMSPQMA